MATTALSAEAPDAAGNDHESIPHRIRRVAAVAAIVILGVVTVSYVKTMSSPSNTAFGVRTVEWLRDNGAAGLVAQVETWYYELTAPSKGGPALKALPQVGERLTHTPLMPSLNLEPPAKHSAQPAAPTPVLASERPLAVAPLIHPALAGEGVWRPTRSGLGSAPPLLVTSLRDEPAYPRVVVGLAWIDTRRTRTQLYAGRVEPTVTLPRGPMEVPPSKRNLLIAAFNSGFKLTDAGGSLGRAGYALGGHTYAPLKNGLGTFVGYKDGRVNIINWSAGATAPPAVLYARQNLPLIVEGGRPNPALNTSAAWGATVGNAILVWRSGIGIDRYGNLIYVAGNDQTVISLAGALIRAGAVRAMQLDINSYWVSFISYTGFNAFGPTNLLPQMNHPATRYLTPDDRDFFAVSLRSLPLP